MGIIEDVYSDREDLARVLKKHTGIRKIVEDLYPDSAHFIYELLQNAEDTCATSAKFILAKENLIFEHNGRPFAPEDIFAITDIGEGTKANDENKIGRFGVGFKAVFAYTETPRIWSPTFSFMITDLVLPVTIDSANELGNITRFEFPFNNHKKLPETAFSEVYEGLTQISETTLLFLTHLESIGWVIEEGPCGEVLRVQHSASHFENLKQIDGKTTTSAHFLKFDESVPGLEKQRAAVAFALELLPKVQHFDSTKALVQQVKITPAAQGRVAVFFPAEKETSGLRFHLHAPFVPELSRASIKVTPANEPLFDQLAKLTAKALHQIKNLGLLTIDFLSVLPNPQDSIPPRYSGIRTATINEMNTKPLTPTYEREHAPAHRLLQATAALKELLSNEDIEYLVEYYGDPPLWAASAPQRNSNSDRFLSALSIRQWDSEEFIELLDEKANPNYGGPDEDLISWLSSKSSEWHQKLYAYLYKELEPEGDIYQLNELSIVRLDSGKYSSGPNSYFPGESKTNDDILPLVDILTFTSGKSKTQQENARKLLEEIGVREIGEAEQIELILRQRYAHNNTSPKKQDLKRFISLVEREPNQASLFSDFYIFEGQNGNWYRPQNLYIDQPFMDTGLSSWHAQYDNGSKKECSLNHKYLNCGIKLESLVKFAIATGVRSRLHIYQHQCRWNPRWDYLREVGGSHITSSSIDEDFLIPGLKKILETPSLSISKLVWNTMMRLPRYPSYLRATYQKNQKNGARQAESDLVFTLRSAAWIPQGKSLFVKPAEALRERLPEGFAFDAGWQWLLAIQFGVESTKRTEDLRQKKDMAKQLGFNDIECLERARRFTSVPLKEQERFLAELDRRNNFELPNHEPSNIEHRNQRTKKLAESAPERVSEERARSVPIGLAVIKEEAAQYLRQQYTNNDGIMICQICKERLPFKLDNNHYYFEKVQFLPALKKLHRQNYLTLCPNHGAMFQYANSSSGLIHNMFSELNGNELEVILADRNTTIYFTSTHIIDLHAIIRLEENLNDAEFDEKTD